MIGEANTFEVSFYWSISRPLSLREQEATKYVYPLIQLRTSRGQPIKNVHSRPTLLGTKRYRPVYWPVGSHVRQTYTCVLPDTRLSDGTYQLVANILALQSVEDDKGETTQEVVPVPGKDDQGNLINNFNLGTVRLKQ